MINTKSIAGLLMTAFFLWTMPLVSYAGDNVPHQLKSGDVISADVLNEVFDSLDNVTTGFESPAELVGTWRCTVVYLATFPGYESHYKVDSSGILYFITDTITFTDNGDGTYSYATATYRIHPNPEAVPFTTPEIGEYTVFSNALYIRTPTTGGYVKCTDFLQKISSDKFIFRADGVEYEMVICERLNTTPAIPTDLSATASGLSVVLTWTDNSSDETGFKVTRKDTLEGEYAEIGTTTADTATYTDTLTQSGTYWYRVMATNANGDSLGSNEAMVTVSE